MKTSAVAAIAKPAAITFVQLSDDELQNMDLSSLQAYSDQVSAVIAQEFSAIADAQAVQSQYDYLILTSQSTINGLGYEITANSNLIISSDMQAAEITKSNIILDSNIARYTSTISGHNKTIQNADIQMSSLMAESASITSALAESDKNFVSSATYYSSLYTIFAGKDLAYQAGISNIITTSTLLSNAIITQKKSYDNWQTSSAYTTARSLELSSLNISSFAIQSTLTQYKINEVNAIKNLTSTIDGVTAVSSLYATSIVNQQYYQSLSSQSGVLDLYTAAYSTFQTASALSNASPGNTLVTAAATMAQQRLSTLTVAKGQVTDQTTKLQARVANAVTDTYNVQLTAAQAAVQLEINNINTFMGYANSSIAAVTYYSTQYETTNMQVLSSMAAIKTYSSLYESSVIGSNSFMALVIKDSAAIATQQAMVDSISYSISSLNDEYIEYVSSYNGWMSYSTTMKKEVETATTDLITYSSLYESTNKAIADFTQQRSEVSKKISDNDIVVKTQSTIFEAEQINSLLYQNQIQTSFNAEETAVFQYRETYVRQNLLSQQQYYDACVLQEVQNTSSQNGLLKVAAKGGAFVEIPINTNTNIINTANSNKGTVEGFLNTFATIYSNYATQKANLETVNASLIAQQATFPSVTNAANAFMTDPTQGQAFSNAQAAFIGKQAITQSLQSKVALTQAQINTAKIAFMQTYNRVFQSSDIFNNESTISSFLIQGFLSAVKV